MPYILSDQNTNNNTSAFETAFSATDWVAPDSNDADIVAILPTEFLTGTLTIDVPEASHGKGVRPDIQLWGDSTGPAPNYNPFDDDNGRLIIVIADTDAFDGFLKVR